MRVRSRKGPVEKLVEFVEKFEFFTVFTENFTVWSCDCACIIFCIMRFLGVT
jgi:hypothetical protein